MMLPGYGEGCGGVPCGVVTGDGPAARTPDLPPPAATALCRASVCRGRRDGDHSGQPALRTHSPGGWTRGGPPPGGGGQLASTGRRPPVSPPARLSAALTRPVPPCQRILGVDPGLQRTGFGLIDVEGTRLRYVASGTISTLEAPRGDLPARLKLIVEGLSELQRRYAPQAASVEIVFVNVNPQSTLLLGQARGAALAALVSGGLPVAEYTAVQMKKAVAGHGQASKAQIQEMVMRLLSLPGLPGPDAADALGLAITHAHAQHALSALGAAGGLERRSQSQYRRGRAA
jgi:crossover junction endodeoxyribonuclease RuvC